MDEALKQQIQAIIDECDDLTLATVRDDGYPQATTVSYANDGLKIYFGTSADAQKVANIKKSNKVSFTIDRRYEKWDDIESISAGGTATIVTDPAEIEHVGELMLKKFPQVAELIGQFEEEPTIVRLEPKVVSLLDYRKGFGHTELVAL